MLGRLVTLFAGFCLMLAVCAGLAAAAPPIAWEKPVQLDAGSASHFAEGAAIDCASGSFCVAVGGDGRLLTSTDPTGGGEAWDEAQVETGPEGDLTAVSCASEDFCAAGDESGRLLTSTDPAGGAGAWSAATIDEGREIVDLSCPSADFCAALDEDGRLLVSGEPAAGASAWAEATPATPESAQLMAISCASASLCVGGYGRARQPRGLLVSTDPLAGPGSWEETGADVGSDERFGSGVYGISCPSDEFCAVAFSGGILVSGEPAAGAAGWHLTHSIAEELRPGLAPLEYTEGSISCPSPSFCLTELTFPATESFALGTPKLFVSSQPGTAASWATQALGLGSDFVCASATFCAAIDREGFVSTSAEPGGGSAAWQEAETGALAPSIGWVSCPTATFCAATGTLGRLYTSTDPTDPDSWTVTRLAEWVGRVSCPSADWCTVAAAGPSLLYSTEPAGGAAAWDSVSRPTGRQTVCPSASFCAELSGSDDVLTSADPLSGAASWETTDLKLGSGRLGPITTGALSCPAAKLCALTTSAWALISSDPTGGRGAWAGVSVGTQIPQAPIGPSTPGITCPTTSFCAATTSGGISGVATTDDPTGGRAAWTISQIAAQHHPGSIACAADASICVVLEGGGRVLTSRVPTRQTSEWGTSETIDAGGSLHSVSCALDGSLCAVADDGGIVVGVPGPFTPPPDPQEPAGEEPSAGEGSPAPPLPRTAPAPLPRTSHHRGRRARCVRGAHHHHSAHAAAGKSRLSSAGRRSRIRCVRPH